MSKESGIGLCGISILGGALVQMGPRNRCFCDKVAKCPVVCANSAISAILHVGYCQ